MVYEKYCPCWLCSWQGWCCLRLLILGSEDHIKHPHFIWFPINIIKKCASYTFAPLNTLLYFKWAFQRHPIQPGVFSWRVKTEQYNLIKILHSGTFQTRPPHAGTLYAHVWAVTVHAAFGTTGNSIICQDMWQKSFFHKSDPSNLEEEVKVISYKLELWTIMVHMHTKLSEVRSNISQDIGHKSFSLKWSCDHPTVVKQHTRLKVTDRCTGGDTII